MVMAQPARVPTRDLAWIKQSLQLAIELEYATLPLYLSAMFSLEVQNYTAYNTIRSVAMEEMVHMAIACNMLAALGGTPRLKSIQVNVPARGLPGGSEPDLHILRHPIPADIIAKLPALYPLESDHLRRYTDLSAPVFYGPRFINTNR
jgi:hypothetical protein